MLVMAVVVPVDYITIQIKNYHLVVIQFLLVLVVLHVLALHEVGSNNPDGVDIKKTTDEAGKPLDGVPFHPYFTLGKLPGIIVFLFLFCAVMFFYPDGGGYLIEHPNYEPADPLKTPELFQTRSVPQHQHQTAVARSSAQLTLRYPPTLGLPMARVFRLLTLVLTLILYEFLTQGLTPVLAGRSQVFL